MKSRSRLLLALLVGSLGAGCASTKTADSPSGADAPASKPPAAAATAPSTASPASGVKTVTAAASAAPTAARGAPGQAQQADTPAQRSIYFDFDRFVIRSEFDDLLRRHAGRLAEQKAAKVQIQGHADERGSREYNLALGQKRADAVRARLGQLGIAGHRVETISYGEEKPKAKGHDESAWSENRRGDILFDGEY